MSDMFRSVSIIKKPTIHYDGCSISYSIHLADGTKKTVGIFLPYEKPMQFETHENERIELTSGHCLVQIGRDKEYIEYRAGESFYVPQNSYFSIQVNEVVDYVCHFE